MYKCFKDEDNNTLDDGIKEIDKEDNKKSIKETNTVQSYTKRSIGCSSTRNRCMDTQPF